MTKLTWFGQLLVLVRVCQLFLLHHPPLSGHDRHADRLLGDVLAAHLLHLVTVLACASTIACMLTVPIFAEPRVAGWETPLPAVVATDFGRRLLQAAPRC